MAPLNQPADERVPNDPFADDLRRLVQRASHARLRRHDADADALLREVRALEAAVVQDQRARADAADQIGAHGDESATFLERVTDDRTLRDRADDAGVLLSLYDDLDRAQSWLITLDLTQP